MSVCFLEHGAFRAPVPRPFGNVPAIEESSLCIAPLWALASASSCSMPLGTEVKTSFYEACIPFRAISQPHSLVGFRV